MLDPCAYGTPHYSNSHGGDQYRTRAGDERRNGTRKKAHAPDVAICPGRDRAGLSRMSALRKRDAVEQPAQQQLVDGVDDAVEGRDAPDRGGL